MKSIGYLAILITISVIFYSFTCNKTIMLPSDYKDYAKEWKEIDKLQNEGLPKSALDKVNALFEIAKKDKNHPQLIKCIIYQNQNLFQLEEDAMVATINRMEANAIALEEPAKSVMHSILGQIYNQYLMANSYNLQNRSEFDAFEKKDILTWPIGKFIEASKEHYKTSVTYNGLKQIPIDDFEAILTNSDKVNTQNLNPTLYDFLINRAIQAFANEQNYLSQPKYQFKIEDPIAFAPISEFLKHNFESQQEDAGKLLVLKWYQDLINFHKNDDTIDALMHADLNRLNFVYANMTHEDKEALYLKALNELQEKYKKETVSAEVSYKIAQYYQQRANKYKPGLDDTHKWNNKKALEIAEKAMKDFPGSYGAIQCENLLGQIKQSTLSFQVEHAQLPNQPFRSLINYRNVNEVFVKIIEISGQERITLEGMDRNKYLNFFNNKPVVESFNQALPDDGDYNNHSVEIKMPALELGYYVIIMDDSSNFNKQGSAVLHTFTHVTNLAFWNQGFAEESPFIIVNRNTGAPEQGVKVEIFERQYDRSKRKNNYVKKNEYISDRAGTIANPKTDNRNFRVRISKGNDVYYSDKYFSNYRNRNFQRERSTTHFFTDRAIYRPGQTVFFKAILINKDSNNIPTISKNKAVTVTLYDVNGQVIEKLDLTSNEFGTVNGSFVTPKGLLNGRMSIRSSISGTHYFNVEEYKRPKFEVNFEPVKTAYKLGDEVEASGIAKSLAGAVIDNAEVVYRVERTVSYPYLPWRCYVYNYRPSFGEVIVVANGTTKTDKEGKFVINFTAQDDKSIDQQYKPEFTYRVYATVTDGTGETREANSSVRVGKIAMIAKFDIPNEIHQDSLVDLSIKTENLNGEFEAAKGSVKIELLKAPINILRERYWQKPDQYVMTENEYRKLFPNDIYADEDHAQAWPVAKQVATINFNTEENAKIDLSKMNIDQGTYLLTLTTEDKYGSPIEVKKVIKVYNFKQDGLSDSPLEIKSDKMVYEPGEKVELYIGTQYENAQVYTQIKRGSNIKSEWKKVNRLGRITLDVNESDRGNFFVALLLVKHNNAHQLSYTLVVPWSNKELEIEFETFRDKLLPGQEEEWRLKINGPKGSKVTTELLATMYDASLDVFKKNSWGLNVYPTNRSNSNYRRSDFNAESSRQIGSGDYYRQKPLPQRIYYQLNWFNFPIYNFGYGGGGRFMDGMRDEVIYLSGSGAAKPQMRRSKAAPMEEMAEADLSNAAPPSIDGLSADEEANWNNEADDKKPPIRTDLAETVFFYPNLKTDQDGNLILSFKMKEALTKWKFMALAHTQDLQIGMAQKEIVTQKELMVTPNAPRFFREGDVIAFTAKVDNLTDKDLNGSVELELLDALSQEKINAQLGNIDTKQTISIKSKQSTSVSWKLKIPFAEAQAITYRVIAKAGKHTDGEENFLPVITNRILLTESLPLPVRENSTKAFTLHSLKNATNKSIQHHKFTLEFTSNPAWYAVQALPFIMENSNESSEAIFSRFYANSLAHHITNSNPKIKTVFDRWRTIDTDALKSNLEKNQELKSVLLEETPWVLEAQSEAQQKKNIALLFDFNKMSYELKSALNALKGRQLPDGGFAWYPGGKSNWYITQYILEGLGHLEQLGVVENDPKLEQLKNEALRYIDEEVVAHYKRMKKHAKNLDDDHLGNMAIHYLYTRSFYQNIEFSGTAKSVNAYYQGQAEKYWLNKGLNGEAMIALALDRYGNKVVPRSIVKSLKERAIYSEELGMYWKASNGYNWYQRPIETHALMIELFDEVAKDADAVYELKIWLLKNKQTNHWKTTKATASAIFAMLNGTGGNWINEPKQVAIELGGDKIEIDKTEAGTGYFKTSWDGDKIEKDFADIKVTNPNDQIAWGAVYWQYFEDLDKVKTFEETPLTIKKQLFKEISTAEGLKIQPIEDGNTLSPGDKIKVRIEIRVDRPMEYVHMKDMRASGFEPTNVISRYKWQGGLGYYESTKDVATHFYMDYLPRGTFVFEYPLRVVHKGDFSNGITSIQSYYAPEFSSHSEGIRVEVE